ncbi:TIM barrel protein, partial [bacterium]|nr:TIM barrel protein [bacterium]
MPPNLRNRRKFLKSASALTGAIIGSGMASASADNKGRSPIKSNSIGVSTYSYWGFRRKEFRPIEKCLDIAADQGFDGVEILQVQMEDFSPPYLQKIKKHAFLNGLALMGLSTHQDFVDPDSYKRRHNVEQTIFYIRQAADLGIPTIRINTGRWNTSKNFDHLMENKG